MSHESPDALARLDRLRRKVDFRWWLVYDLLILVGIVWLWALDGWWLLLPAALSAALAFSAFLDVVEFFVKRQIERDVDGFLAEHARKKAKLPSSSGGRRAEVVLAADTSKARVQLQYAESRSQLFSARCAFADALIALEELGHRERAEAIQGRWRDVEVAGLVGREAG